jgi:hypothetical protein
MLLRAEKAHLMTIETTESSTAQHKERNFNMARKDWPTDPAEIQRSIEEAIQDLVRKGLFDSGQKLPTPT